jgi:hypothetical protein
VVGLYISPPEHAIVLCVDEKTQIQALDRTQKSLPLYPGHCGTLTHDYKRNGTTTLFAALNVPQNCGNHHTRAACPRYALEYPFTGPTSELRQSATALRAVASSAAMSLFIRPSAANSRILDRNTSRVGVLRPRDQRISVFRSSSFSVISQAILIGFISC